MDNFVVGIGEVLWDVLPDGRKAGGAPSNFAYHVSQFGLPGRVVSAVGQDSLGKELLSTWIWGRPISSPSRHRHSCAPGTGPCRNFLKGSYACAASRPPVTWR